MGLVAFVKGPVRSCSDIPLAIPRRPVRRVN
jgi:hypothetical protein